jgi:hypothetical protein
MEINNNSSALSNGVATATAKSSSVRTITLCKFVARLDVCPMTAKGFAKRMPNMAKGISFLLIRKFNHLESGNRFTAKSAYDYVMDGYLALITPNKLGVVHFDADAFTYKGESLTQGKFFRLWLKASTQKVWMGNRKGGNAKGKSISSLTTTDADGNTMVLASVEEKAIANSDAPKVEINLLKEVHNLFNLATTNADKRFWQTLERMIEVETSNLPTESVCVFYGWENRNAYYVAKKRLLADDRLQALRKVRALQEIF